MQFRDTVRKIFKRSFRLFFRSTHLVYLDKLSEELRGAGSVLDLGCGANSPLKDIRGSFFVGVDVSNEAIEKSEKAGIHDKYYCSNALDIDKIFSSKNFDVVVALDLLEHLDKKLGRVLLSKMEKVARKKTVIFTPNGFVEQNEDADNPFQRHVSGWSHQEMKEMGYKCFGMGGLKFIKRENGIIKLKPQRFWELLADITQKLTYYCPRLSYYLFCVKNLEDHENSTC